MSGARTEIAQFLILSRHFFGRLFRNETVDFEDQMKERLYVALALLAVFFSWCSWLLLFKYHFVPDINRSWQEKNYIITLMMLLFGVITLLEWDVLFPDRQDFLNLRPLPLRLRTIFAAKLASFVLFIGAFSAAMMSVSSILFSIYLTEWRAKSLALAVRYVFAHILAGFAANFAVFFAVIFLQFFLMAVLPRVLYKGVSLFIRFALLAGLVFFLLSFIAEPTILGRSFHELEPLKTAGDPFLLRFPPLWFVGLYETLLGTQDPLFAAQARTAGLALVLALAAFAASGALSYRRHVRKTLEARKSRPAWLGLREAWRRLLGATVLRAPEERVVYNFFSDTLKSSAKHRIAFAYYLGVAVAAILLLVAAYRDAFRSLTPTNGFLLALPLVVAFTLVVGSRVLVNEPVALEANWIFRLTETPRPMKYLTGLKKAVALKLLLPLFIAVFGVSAFLWGAQTAGLQAAFGFTVSLLGVEAAFYRYQKIPYASAFVPGRLKLHFTAIPGLVGLLLLMLALTAIEKAVLREPWRGLLVLAGAAAAGAAFAAGNRRLFRTGTLVYEEEPEPAMIGFPEGP